MRRLTVLLSIVMLLLAGCAGSTSFLGDFTELDMVPGATQTVVMELEAEGSHAGDYEFKAVPSVDWISGTLDPTSAEVDGVIEITVNVMVASDADERFGSLSIEAWKKDELRASQAILVELPAQATE